MHQLPQDIVLSVIEYFPIVPYWNQFRLLNHHYDSIIGGMLYGDDPITLSVNEIRFVTRIRMSSEEFLSEQTRTMMNKQMNKQMKIVEKIRPQITSLVVPYFYLKNMRYLIQGFSETLTQLTVIGLHEKTVNIVQSVNSSGLKNLKKLDIVGSCGMKTGQVQNALKSINLHLLSLNDKCDCVQTNENIVSIKSIKPVTLYIDSCYKQQTNWSMELIHYLNDRFWISYTDIIFGPLYDFGVLDSCDNNPYEYDSKLIDFVHKYMPIDELHKLLEEIDIHIIPQEVYGQIMCILLKDGGLKSMVVFEKCLQKGRKLDYLAFEGFVKEVENFMVDDNRRRTQQRVWTIFVNNMEKIWDFDLRAFEIFQEHFYQREHLKIYACPILEQLKRKIIGRRARSKLFSEIQLLQKNFLYGEVSQIEYMMKTMNETLIQRRLREWNLILEISIHQLKGIDIVGFLNQNKSTFSRFGIGHNGPTILDEAIDLKEFEVANVLISLVEKRGGVEAVKYCLEKDDFINTYSQSQDETTRKFAIEVAKQYNIQIRPTKRLRENDMTNEQNLKRLKL